MTEATCNISVNPIEGERKIGSVGIPLPYTKIKIIKESANGSLLECKLESQEKSVLLTPVLLLVIHTPMPKRIRTFITKRFFQNW